MKMSDGSISGYLGPTQSETVLDGLTPIVATQVPANWGIRVCAAGLKIRSTASISSEAGIIQAYASPLPTTANFSTYRDSPHIHMYGKGEVAEVRYLPYDYSELQLSAKNGLLAYPGIVENHHLGFMICGGTPGSSYTLQYSITFEYVTTSFTDLVPARQSEEGDHHKVLRSISHNNAAKPATWSLTTPQAVKSMYNAAANAWTGFTIAGPTGAIAGGLGSLAYDYGNGAYSTGGMQMRSGNVPLMIGNGDL